MSSHHHHPSSDTTVALSEAQGDPQAPLTDYEAELYDRSIRTWGIEAQQRIRMANILLVGFRSLNAEICKNLVLAGVNAVTILDMETTTELDLGSHIFLTSADIGKNRAEAAVPNVKALNPLVNVQHAYGDPQTMENEFLSKFNIVCATLCPLSTLVKLNKQCREMGVYFIAADTFGLSGYFFSDLREFQYTIVEKPPDDDKEKGKEKVNKGEGEPVMKKARKDCTSSFVSLDKALATKWTKLDRRTAKLYFGMQLAYALKEHKAQNKIIEDDNAASIWKSIVTEHDGNESVLSKDYRAQFFNFGVEFMPVSAIVGGIAAQEMIKILSANDEPLNNFFFYDSSDGSGLVEKIHS